MRRIVLLALALPAIPVHAQAPDAPALDAAPILQDPTGDVRTEASMIKVTATEMAQDVLDHAMQAYGAMGMTKEMPLTRSRICTLSITSCGSVVATRFRKESPATSPYSA